MMNKKGILLLRNVVFMVILFGGVMALASIFVLDIAGEYSNTNMTNEYNRDGTGSVGQDTMDEIDSSMDKMKDATDPVNESGGLFSSFSSFGGAVSGAGKIIKAVYTSPQLISNASITLMTAVGVPDKMTKIVSNMILLLIYAVVIFGIMTAVLRGGKV